MKHNILDTECGLCVSGRAGFVDVVMGAHDLTQNEPSQVTMTSTDFTVHEEWHPFLIENDISVIRLPSVVGLTGK